MKIKEILIGIRDWALGKLSAKQDILVSGENIKSINNESLLGEGNISIPKESDIVWEKGTGDNSVQQKGTGAVARGDNSVATGNGVASGKYSHSEGQDGEASGDWSHNEGGYTFAKGDRSHAEGNTTYAEGTNSHAEGINTHAYGQNSHTEGADTTTGDANKIDDTDPSTGYGWNSHAEGNSSIAHGSTAHAEGYHTVANGFASHSEGNNTTSNGANSHVEGDNNTTNGVASHAEGSGTKADGMASHAEGQSTTALSSNCHAEGINTTANGWTTHAEGNKTVADGDVSHAEGNFSHTIGAASHAEGIYTIANNRAEHAEGHYNKSNKASDTFGGSGNTLHSVGIGTGSGTTPRKNAFEIMQNGDAHFYGVGTYNGTNPISGKNDLKTILNNKKNKSESIMTSFSPFNNVSYTVRASDNQTLSNLAALISASGYEAKALNFLEFTTDDNYEAICLQENIDECKFVRISSWYNMEDGSTKTTYLYDNPADNIRKVLTIVITIDNDTREFASASFELKDAPTSGSGTEPLFVDCNYDPYNHTIYDYSDVEVPFQEVATAFDSGRPVIFRDGANEFSGLLIACHNGAGWGSCAVGSPDGIVTISIT